MIDTIYIVGNEAVEEDSLPVRLLPKLAKSFPGIDFVQFDPTESISDKNLILIDTIANVEEVVVVSDIDSIEQNRSYSLHDFDLGLSLKIMKKLGKTGDVTIIGVPPDMDEEKAVVEMGSIISNLLSGSEKRS